LEAAQPDSAGVGREHDAAGAINTIVLAMDMKPM
jgi:hypothetical protein